MAHPQSIKNFSLLTLTLSSRWLVGGEGWGGWRSEDFHAEIFIESNAMMDDFRDFMGNPWVKSLRDRYRKKSILADSACKQILADLEKLNKNFIIKTARGAITTAEVRRKTEESFFRKLFKKCQKYSPVYGITEKKLRMLFDDIRDLCGARFSCPYLDEVKKYINEIIRPSLINLSYVTELAGQLKDKDYLDKGDDQGYRSYHFYVKVPVTISIYGDREYCLCEVQGRSELQQVWAKKSHDLLYKPNEGWEFGDAHVRSDMKNLSDHLRVADNLLISIRDRIRKSGA